MIKIIAEPANYWHGDFNLLKGVMSEAIACQADFFKLQLFNPARMGNAWKGKRKRYEMMEIKAEHLTALKEMADNYGIELIGTVNTTDKIELLQEKDVNNVKIASGQLHPLLVNAIAGHRWDRVFVSTGMIIKVEELEIIDSLEDCCDELIVMHCVSLYPTHDVECNMGRITSLKTLFPNYTIGYSDHHMDELPCIIAMAMGAEYIEKHFILEPCFGPTSEIGSSPKELERICMVRNRVNRMMGNGQLSCQNRECESYRHYQGRFLLDG